MNTSLKKLHWTEHSKAKMRQYGLSKSKLMNLLYKPERKEKGIVPGTMAMMKTNKSYSKSKHKKAPGEIWLMYKDIKESLSQNKYGTGQVRKIISAWRYPGISKHGEAIPIPEDIRQEILSTKEF